MSKIDRRFVVGVTRRALRALPDERDERYGEKASERLKELRHSTTAMGRPVTAVITYLSSAGDGSVGDIFVCVEDKPKNPSAAYYNIRSYT